MLVDSSLWSRQMNILTIGRIAIKGSPHRVIDVEVKFSKTHWYCTQVKFEVNALKLNICIKFYVLLILNSEVILYFLFIYAYLAASERTVVVAVRPLKSFCKAVVDVNDVGEKMKRRLLLLNALMYCLHVSRPLSNLPS